MTSVLVALAQARLSQCSATPVDDTLILMHFVQNAKQDGHLERSLSFKKTGLKYLYNSLPYLAVP